MSDAPKVVSLDGGMIPAVAAEPHEGLVEMLEALTEKARSGEIQCVAYAAQHADGAFVQEIMGRWSGYGLVGSLEVVKAEAVLVHLGAD